MKARSLLPILFSCLVSSLLAESVKDREGAVRADRAAMENDKRWAYNDLESGFRRAKLTGKPLLVVMRCVPCLSCMGLDSAILMQGQSLDSLLDQFVCVRVINANALDLTRFQFDFDLSFSTLFFNGDGTLYGRYGSWTHQKNAADTTLTGYQRALEAALKIHAGYPQNKPQLAGKQGGPIPFVTPTDMPTLGAKYQRELNWEGKVVQSCIHCHMIGEALRTSYRDQRKPIPAEWIYPMPAPQTVGLTLAPDQIAHVTEVMPDSYAAKAGVQAGDDVLSLAGQPLVSSADFAWVLHRSGDSAEHEMIVQRAGVELPLKLELPSGWRFLTSNEGRVGAWGMRGMATGGLLLVDLTDEERAQRSLPKSGMALWVKGLGLHGKHGAAKRAGFQKDDVILEFDGLNDRLTESRLLGHLLQKRLPGEKVPVTLLRGEERHVLQLPMQ